MYNVGACRTLHQLVLIAWNRVIFAQSHFIFWSSGHKFLGTPIRFVTPWTEGGRFKQIKLHWIWMDTSSWVAMKLRLNHANIRRMETTSRCMNRIQRRSMKLEMNRSNFQGSWYSSMRIIATSDLSGSGFTLIDEVPSRGIQSQTIWWSSNWIDVLSREICIVLPEWIRLHAEKSSQVFRYGLRAIIRQKVCGRSCEDIQPDREQRSISELNRKEWQIEQKRMANWTVSLDIIEPSLEFRHLNF
jgi:hypothetical protein